MDEEEFINEFCPNITPWRVRRIRRKINERKQEEIDQGIEDVPADEPQENFGLPVNIGGTRTVNVQVWVDWTIRRVLEELRDRHAVFPAQSNLQHQSLYYRGAEVEHARTLRSLDILDGTHLLSTNERRQGGAKSVTKGGGDDTILMKPLRVTLIGLNGTKIALPTKYSPIDTIITIKKGYLSKINNKFSINEIQLFTIDNNKNELENHSMLKDYGIYKDVILKVSKSKKKTIKKRQKWKVPLESLDSKGLKDYFYSMTMTESIGKIYLSNTTPKDFLNIKSAQDFENLFGIDKSKAQIMFAKLKEQKKIDKMPAKEKKQYKEKMGKNYKNIQLSKWNIYNVSSFINDLSFYGTNKVNKEKIVDYMKINGINGLQLFHLETEKEFSNLFTMSDFYCKKKKEEEEELKKKGIIEKIISYFEVDEIAEEKEEEIEKKDNKKMFSNDIIKTIYNKVQYYKEIEKKNFDEKEYKENDEVKLITKTNPFIDYNKQRRIVLKRYPHLKLSKKTDCIWQDTNVKGLRVEMECGHAIMSKTMYRYIISIFDKKNYQYRILCPVDNCRKEWDWVLCTKIADFDKNEFQHWNKIRQLRKLKDFTECPNCKTLCQRFSTSNSFKMKCNNCNYGPHWCFSCKNIWKNSSINSNICGNKNCDAIKNINAQLQGCELADFGTQNVNIKCPNIRACPYCMVIIERTTGCRHMKCSCKKEFCFLCLKKWYTCTPSKDPNMKGYCDVVPRQKF